mmetsp:Transcript_28391/g.50717  ORF Transcript_28391/g.50717 Transcript_28391/m.50717 type:complete len:186 (-) Transcript_28391:386-943(-)
MPRPGDEEEGTVIEIISDSEEETGSTSAAQRNQSRQHDRQHARAGGSKKQRRSIPVRFRSRAGESHDVSDVVDLTIDTSQGADDDDVLIVSADTPEAKRRRAGHATTSQKGKAAAAGLAGAAAAPVPVAALKCPVCLDRITNMTSTTCGHVFCQDCIKVAVKAQKKCPTCRKNVTLRGLHRIYLS